MILKTKDGKEIDLKFARRSKMFRLGFKASKEGWGQEGGAWQKNGPAFRTGWHAQQCTVNRGMDHPYTEAEIRKAIEDDVQKGGDARLNDDEPTGIYFTFIHSPDQREFGHSDIYVPTCALYFTMDGVDWEQDQRQGSGYKTALIAFEATSQNPRVSGTPLLLNDTDLRAFVRMFRWAKKEEGAGHGRIFNHICQCIFKMMFAERILRRWYSEGCPEGGNVQILE